MLVASDANAAGLCWYVCVCVCVLPQYVDDEDVLACSREDVEDDAVELMQEEGGLGHISSTPQQLQAGCELMHEQEKHSLMEHMQQQQQQQLEEEEEVGVEEQWDDEQHQEPLNRVVPPAAATGP